MKKLSIFFFGSFLLLTGCASNTSNYTWQEKKESLALVNGENILWQLNYRQDEGKPYFHPVCLSDGSELTWLRPEDHPWHRAIWFSWKFINGLNYWEENKETGLAEGRTDLINIDIETKKNKSAKVKMKIVYHPPDDVALLTEQRIFDVSSPDADGNFRIDWTSIFTANQDVNLERTPLPGEDGGKGHGGYAGASVRLVKCSEGWKVVNSNGVEGGAAHGKDALWVDYTGKTSTGAEGGIAVLDHRSNMRHPSPWYIAKGNMVYFSPAPLFNRGLKLSKWETFTLRYRILIHNGPVEKKVLDKEWKKFSRK